MTYAGGLPGGTWTIGYGSIVDANGLPATDRPRHPAPAPGCAIDTTSCNLSSSTTTAELERLAGMVRSRLPRRNVPQ
ncbi:MAG: hypothetical protein IPH35_25175 [Rhodoferax sp.]|nr:hypothetical protein [Rhodoferax sp.]